MKKYILSIITLTLIICSCGETNEENDSKILFNFHHSCDNVALSNNLLSHTNEAGENYNVQTLKYILTDIKLNGENKDIMIKDIHFVDFNDPSTMFIESDVIENGSYTLSFRFGIDADSNVDSLLWNYTNFYPTMVWPPTMGGGCHYMKLEGAYNNDSTFYNTHTGPTMGMDHSFEVEFDMLNINIENSTENLEYSIQMNVNNWYENPNTVNLAPMIMMDMQKQMQLMNNGMTDVFSFQSMLD